jgi:hypothetical protein
VALLVAALLVALGAGGSVYALMNGDGTERHRGPMVTSTGPTAGEPPVTAPGPGPSGSSAPPNASPTPGALLVPPEYVGTWDSSIDTAAGHSTRRLVIRQGRAGDKVLSLTADGPLADGGTYHCVFQAPLQSAPHGKGPVKIGPSVVTVGRPASSCTPGAASTLTVLPDGRLRRDSADSDLKMTYTKSK